MTACLGAAPCFASEVYAATAVPVAMASEALAVLVRERYVVVAGGLLRPNKLFTNTA
jgi:hypothetical protein